MNEQGFGIYVHWPFCLHKCPYCDFNSHVRQGIDQDAWLNAYVEAIETWSDYRAGEELTSIYFGGGTPSTCPPQTIDTIIRICDKYWDISKAEITLEANPTSTEASNFESYAASGVNRVSIGFQAFNNNDLKRLGRMHSVDESLQALEIARKYFARTNFDLIYARQDQTLKDWKNELNQLIELNPSHISLYQLTIEPNTRFGEMFERGILRGLPADDLSHEMYTWTRDFMRDQGFIHYEVSNFALPGDQSKHNLIYWNYGDYLGIGPGAHGRIWKGQNRLATTQQSNPEKWLQNPIDFEEEVLTLQQTLEEYIIMGLRIESGVELSRLSQFGFELEPEIISDLRQYGLIKLSNSHLSVTDKGRLVLNAVIEKLLAN